MITEILEVSGELLINFNLKTEGDSTRRRIPDEELEDYIRGSIVQTIEDMGITVDETRMYNFDVYKSRKEVGE